MPNKVELVAVRRLDEVLDELGDIGRAKRIFLKMDTQGYDTRVFHGLGERVRDVVAMQSEVSLIPIYEDMPHWTESIEMYEAAGFGVVGLYPVTRDDGRVIEYDCLLKRSTPPPAVEPMSPELTTGTIPAMNGPRRLLVGALVVLLTLLDRQGADRDRPDRAAFRGRPGDPAPGGRALAGRPAALPGERVHLATGRHPAVPLPAVHAPVLRPADRASPGARGNGRRRDHAAGGRSRPGAGSQIPWIWLPLVLAWPPFAEAIFGANIQMLLFAAFVFLFFRAGGVPWRAPARDVADPAESGALVGGLAVVVGAIKVSQPHPWVYVLRYRPRAAIGGALVMVAIVAATLPLTGIDLWFDYLAQLKLAADPTWDLGGFQLARFAPAGIGLVVAIACIVGVWFVPRERAAAWIGVLSVVGALSLHIFGLLFLVPAMLLIRLEAALLAAIFIATYSYEGAWAGILICVAGTRGRRAGGPDETGRRGAGACLTK